MKVEERQLPVPCRQLSAVVEAAVKSLPAESGAVHIPVPGPGLAVHTWQWILPWGLAQHILEPAAAGRKTVPQAAVAVADHTPLFVDWQAGPAVVAAVHM